MEDTHVTEPERLSTRWTPYLRTLVPPLSAICLGLATAALVFGWADPSVPTVVRVLAGVAWPVVSWWMFKWFGSFRDVWLEQDDLLVSDGERRVRLPLREVTNIRQSRFTKTKTITLELSRNTPLGNRVRFVPHMALVANFMDHPVARELRERRERVLPSGGNEG